MNANMYGPQPGMGHVHNQGPMGMVPPPGAQPAPNQMQLNPYGPGPAGPNQGPPMHHPGQHPQIGPQLHPHQIPPHQGPPPPHQQHQGPMMPYNGSMHPGGHTISMPPQSYNTGPSPVGMNHPGNSNYQQLPKRNRRY